jgi:succinate-semialdehyde dehydrogenase/glutarate-semialdehyde dehydrogenase
VVAFQLGVKDISLIKTQGLIDGKWVDAKDGGRIAVSSESFTGACAQILRRNDLIDPATSEELGTVPEMGLTETREAIEAASKAFQSWGRTTAKVTIS